MASYSEIATKEDKAMFKAAKVILRGGFDDVVKEAKQAFESAYSSCNSDLKRNNAARRAANQVILAAMRKKGVSNWKEFIANNQ